MQMSPNPGAITAVTRCSVSARGSEPSATSPTESRSTMRSERPRVRPRYHEPATAKQVPTAITPMCTIWSAVSVFMFQAGLATAAAIAARRWPRSRPAPPAAR